MGEKRNAGALAPRVNRLEKQTVAIDHRVEVLERRTGLPTPPPPESESPHQTKPDTKTGAKAKRCPGCSLEVKSLGVPRCEWCGFIFSALGPL